MIRSIVGFVSFCRMQGFLIGTQQVKEAIQILEVGYLDKKMMKNCLRSICCKNKNEFDLFPRVFDIFWHQKPLEKKRDKIKHQHKPRHIPASLIWLGGEGKSSSEGEDAKEVTGASTLENLKKTDFSAVREIDEEALNKLAFQLWRQMSMRLIRRKKKSKRGEVDLRKSLRRSISQGGWPARLAFRSRKQEKRKLLLLLDVSGSMDKYSFYLLKFIYVLTKYFKFIETFAFSTQLYHLTEILKKRDLTDILDDISKDIDAFSSGTKIAVCLRHFVDNYSMRVLSKKCVVVILSDGLETGNVHKLTKVIQQIKRKSKMLIWLNPLKGMKGYQPIQRGMAGILPFIDIFASAHNLNSLLDLEKHLQEI